MCFSVMDCLNWICLLTARVCDICHDTGTKHPQQILEVVDSWSLCGREVDPNNWAEHNTAPSGCWDGLTVTLFTATGDFGLSCTETTQERGVHYPASSPCSYIRTIIRGDKQIHFPLKDAKGEGKHQILLNFFGQSGMHPSALVQPLIWWTLFTQATVWVTLGIQRILI